MRVGDYETEEVLGTGGFGTVFRARHTKLAGRVVALKVARPSTIVGHERSIREAETLARLSHPNIVTVHDAGTTAEGALYIVMELVAGSTLAAEIERGAPLEILLDRLVEAARGVAFAHERGVIHRDLKPSNILIGPGGAKVCDFGIAKQLDRETVLTRTGDFVGTLDYIAPEQAAGEKVGPTADVHALGAILYEILAGRTPRVAASPHELLIMLALGKLEPPSEAAGRKLPAALEELCVRSLAKDPARRPANARAFLDALERARTSPEPARRSRIALAAALAVLVVAVVAATVLLRGRVPPPPSPSPSAGPVSPPPISPAGPGSDEPAWYRDLVVASSAAPPSWFESLPAGERPKLPPDIRFLPDEGEFLNVADGSVLVWLTRPSPVFMGKREVTVAQFERFGARAPVPLAAHPGKMTAGRGKDLVPNALATWRNPHGDERVAPADSPVRQVTWTDASLYAEWARARLPAKRDLHEALGAGLGGIKWGAPGEVARLGRLEKRILQRGDRRDDLQDLVATEWCAETDPTDPRRRLTQAVGARRGLSLVTSVAVVADESDCSNATTFRIVRSPAPR
ncbi:MAG: bifunctional serine/threonine-protein kinase/formylglycine-generating enzyme family protein [Planctomycetota bacterium]